MILKRAELFRSGSSTDTCRAVAFRYVCDSFTAKSAHLSTPGPTKRALAMAKRANLAAAVILLMSTINGGLTFEEAFARGALVAKNGGVVCACAPRASATSLAGGHGLASGRRTESSKSTKIGYERSPASASSKSCRPHLDMRPR